MLLVIVAVAAIVFTRNRSSAAETAARHEAHAEVYYCPMHPTVQSDKPGNCPICGMSLVRRTGTPQNDAAGQLAAEGFEASEVAAISLSPEQRVTANVRTTTVSLQTASADIITTGRITFDERRVAQVTAYSGGRVERLYVNFTGDTVRRGQVVASIYSPELFSAQQEYLLALRNHARMESAGFENARSASRDLAESSKRRLLLMGMSERQIAQVEQGGKPLVSTSVVSPVSGVVTQKFVVPQQYVATGQPLFEVADLSQVWVDADVYEQQLSQVHHGQAVQITSPALPGTTLSGKVSFIQPVIAGQTRTATVRIDLPNPQLAMKPDTFVTVRLVGGAVAEHIMVPASAIVDRGQSTFAWVQTSPGSYEPRKVTTGERHGDQLVVTQGLQPGDVIVTNGGFLLDSEAQLRNMTSGHQEHQP